MITNPSINRAIDYILHHINSDISVDDIAAHCNYSRHYFSRMFKAETGESVGAFLKRIKMEQSAFRLKVEKSRSITAIGWDYGYSSSNYSSAFRQHHTLSPLAFRRCIAQKSMANPIFRDAAVELETFAVCDKRVTIEALEDHAVIYHRHKGSYGNLSAHWGAFLETYREYINERTLLLERTYDDPSITDTDECLYDICITAPENCRLANMYTMKGGKFAMYHFKGAAKHIYTAYQNMFQVWLPQSGYCIDDRYGFEIYREIDCETMYMELDLCIPVK